MPYTFPASPTVGQTSVQNGRTYTWSGYAWELLGNTTNTGGGSPTTDASLLTTGTLNDARLSANVVLTGDARLSDARTPTSHASSHASVGSDPLTLGAGQITGLSAVATSGSYTDLSDKPTIPAATTSASDLTSGTLSDARLSFTPLHPFLLMGG